MTVEQLITNNLDLWTSAVTHKKTSGRGSSAKPELTGIKKLRELILELAVRGKLVPQFSKDGAGAAAVEQMREDRDRMIRQGVSKRQKPGPKPEQLDKPFGVPDTWEWATLPMVARYAPGKTPPTKNSIYWADASEGHAWVSIADMEHYGEVSETARRVSDIGASEVFKSDPVPAGAILMSFKLTVGKVAINRVPAYHNEAIISIFPFNGLEHAFLFKVLPLLAATGGSKSAIKGNTLNAQSIAAILVPVPPLAEQHRIVQKVDELMALCDRLEQQTGDQIEAHERLVDTLLDTLTRSANATELAENWARVQQHFDTLFTTEHSIDRLKQTILQLAVMGRLVPQDPTDECGQELLDKIDALKAAMPGSERSKGTLSVVTLQASDCEFSLPQGWVWTTFGSVWVDSFYGPRFGKGEYVSSGGGVPTIRTTDMDEHGGVTLDGCPRVGVPPEKLELYSLRPGDLLITRSGSIGTMAVFNADAVAIPSAYLIRIRLVPQVLPRYAYIFLKSPIGQAALGLSATSVGVPNVNATNMSKFQFPLPSNAEQERIVRQVDRLFSICDSLRDQINCASDICSALAERVVSSAVH